MKSILILFLLTCLISASFQQDEEDVVIEEAGKAPAQEENFNEDNEYANDEYMKAAQEVETMLTNESPEQRELRILRVYACALMVRVHLVQNMKKIKTLIEGNKNNADMIYAKIMGAMGAKCYKKIQPQEAQDVFWG